VPNYLLAICLDFGDTLIDQATEIKDDTLTTMQAELIPGADQALYGLKQRGYRLAIVSNGPVGSVPNVFEHYGLYGLFDVFAVSQGLGVEKPDPDIFKHALDHLGIVPEAYGRTVMVGNDLAADIAGANGLGMISVWLDWAPRHRKAPLSELEVPDYTVSEPLALLNLLDGLELQFAKDRSNS
jgi:putative hydrolase of the HAD superfamily